MIHPPTLLSSAGGTPRRAVLSAASSGAFLPFIFQRGFCERGSLILLPTPVCIDPKMEGTAQSPSQEGAEGYTEVGGGRHQRAGVAWLRPAERDSMLSVRAVLAVPQGGP